MTQGPLEFFARCIIDVSGQDGVDIMVTSSVDGWFSIESAVPLPAGAMVIRADVRVSNGFSESYDDAVTGAIAPGGHFIGPFVDVHIGLNILGHPCQVQGSTTAFTGIP